MHDWGGGFPDESASARSAGAAVTLAVLDRHRDPQRFAAAQRAQLGAGTTIRRSTSFAEQRASAPGQTGRSPALLPGEQADHGGRRLCASRRRSAACAPRAQREGLRESAGGLARSLDHLDQVLNPLATRKGSRRSAALRAIMLTATPRQRNDGMSDYLVKRLIGALPVLFGVVRRHLLSDAADTRRHHRRDAGPDGDLGVAREELRHALGLDQPILVQYVPWLVEGIVGRLRRDRWPPSLPVKRPARPAEIRPAPSFLAAASLACCR